MELDTAFVVVTPIVAIAFGWVYGTIVPRGLGIIVPLVCAICVYSLLAVYLFSTNQASLAEIGKPGWAIGGLLILCCPSWFGYVGLA